MKVAMIGYLGMSPAVMTEMAKYLISERLTDVIMLPTRDEKVIAGARLVEAALKVNYPRLRVHIHFLPLKDVTNEKENLVAARELARAICVEKFNYEVYKLYLNIAGGRKETTVMAALLGMFMGVTAVYHVVNKNVKDLNIYQHKIENIINQFAEEDLEKRKQIYIENKEALDKLLFPDPRDLEFIRIPIIPPLPEELSILKRLLSPGGVDLIEDEDASHALSLFINAGLVEASKTHAWPTELGEEIGKMIRCEYR